MSVKSMSYVILRNFVLIGLLTFFFNINSQAENAVENVYYNSMRSVVAIEIQLDDGTPIYGTGGILTKDGYILTVAHLIPSGKRVSSILVKGEKESIAEVIWISSTQDMMLIRSSQLQNLIPLRRERLSAPAVGEKVHVLSFPLSPDGSRNLAIVEGSIASLPEGGYVSINVSVSNSSSGAPVLDRDGNLIGLVSGKIQTDPLERTALMLPTNELPDKVNGYLHTVNSSEDDYFPLCVGNISRYRVSGVPELEKMIITTDGEILHEGKPCVIQICSEEDGTHKSITYVAKRGSSYYVLGNDDGFFETPRLTLKLPLEIGSSWEGGPLFMDGRSVTAVMKYVGKESISIGGKKYTECLKIEIKSTIMDGYAWYAKRVGLIKMDVYFRLPEGESKNVKLELIDMFDRKSPKRP